MTIQRKGIALVLVSCIVPAMLAARPATAKSTSCDAARASSLDVRLSAKVDEGPAALRRFIERTRTIYALDWQTALARADRFRTARAACEAES